MKSNKDGENMKSNKEAQDEKLLAAENKLRGVLNSFELSDLMTFIIDDLNADTDEDKWLIDLEQSKTKECLYPSELKRSQQQIKHSKKLIKSREKIVKDLEKVFKEVKRIKELMNG
jgi:hypothetical protein